MPDILWYYARDDEQLGPISTQDLRQLVAEGKLLPEDFVWKEGMEEWAPANRLQGLFPDSGSIARQTPVDVAVSGSGEQRADKTPPPAARQRPARRLSGRSIWAVQLLLWTICVMVVLIGGILFSRAWLRARSPEEAIAAGAMFSTFFIGSYVIARAGEKIAHLMMVWSARSRSNDRP